MRDWTRFLCHRIKKYPDSPVHTLSDSLRIYFFPLWRADLFFSGFAVEFAGYVWTVAVSGTKKLRIRKYPDTCGRGLRFRNPKSTKIHRRSYYTELFVMDEELSDTDNGNTTEYSQDEFENVEVEVAESEANRRSYEREDDSQEPCADEPLEERKGKKIAVRDKNKNRA